MVIGATEREREMISVLTEEQERKLQEYALRHVPLISRTGHLERSDVEFYVDKLYSLDGVQRPRKIWVPSPREAALSARALFESGSRLTKFLGITRVIDVYNNLRASVDNKLLGKIYCSLGSQAFEFRDSSYSSVDFGCDRSVEGFPKRLISFSDIGWVISIDFLHNVLGLPVPEFRNCLYYGEASFAGCEICWAFDDVVVLSEPPIEYVCNDWYFPHNLKGPAIKFADGHELWFYHGTKLDKKQIERPDMLTVQEVLDSLNPPAVAGLYGWGRFLQDVSASIIEKDPLGSLYLIPKKCSPFGPIEDARVFVFSAYGNEIVCRVPLSVSTVAEALAYVQDSPKNVSALHWPGKKLARIWGEYCPFFPGYSGKGAVVEGMF